MMNQLVAEMLHFFQQSPTAFHAVDAAARMLEGYDELKECDAWQLEPGGHYYVTRNRSSIIAFTMPQGAFSGFQLVASHSDSPTFKLKENAELVMPGKYVRLDVEAYGGAILSSWFDRPLSVAGRVMVRTPEGIRTRLVNLERDTVIIPNVAIHMNRDINSGYKYNMASDTMPLWGDASSQNTFRQQIADALGVQTDDIVGSDLYLYNRMPGTVWGSNADYVSVGRLDDLECAYSSLLALKKARPCEGHVNVCCIFDNEEVGSTTKQGANSTFLEDVLRRIALSMGLTEEDYLRALSSSFMLSADNAHAVHPNHPELSDPVNQVLMNGGIVIKSNARQKYTTDAVSSAIFGQICAQAQVPVQYFSNRSDMAGGSTLGNISGAHVSIHTVDIGLAQLAMHSCYETAGTRDLDYMVRGMTAFYETDIHARGDGEYELKTILQETEA